jgi:thioredoxin reductase (NADPH)
MGVSGGPADSADVVVIGGGPCGLAAAVALERAGFSAPVIERGCVVSGIASYPTYMTFFSTAEKLGIGDIPFVVAGEKPTRRDALAYYRAVAEHYGIRVRQYENVERVERDGDHGYVVSSRVERSGELVKTRAQAVVIATGYFGRPNALGVPGEDLPHVSHLFIEGHEGWDQDVVVVGGGNSAVDAALDLYRAGARVSIVHYRPGLKSTIKSWVLPDIANRLTEGSIRGYFGSRVVRITPDEVIVETPEGEARVPAQHVYPMLGYQPNSALLTQLGVPMDEETGVPAHDPATMETSVPGVFIAGVLASGFDANKTFIENGRHHGGLIAAALAGRGAPR